MILSVVAARGIGQLIGFFLIWIDSKLRNHYVPTVPPKPLVSVSPLFFDKSFIENLRGL